MFWGLVFKKPILHKIPSILDKSEVIVTIGPHGNWLELHRHCPPQTEYLTSVLLQSPLFPTVS